MTDDADVEACECRALTTGQTLNTLFAVLPLVCKCLKAYLRVAVIKLCLRWLCQTTSIPADFISNQFAIHPLSSPDFICGCVYQNGSWCRVFLLYASRKLVFLYGCMQIPCVDMAVGAQESTPCPTVQFGSLHIFLSIYLFYHTLNL